MSLLLNSWGRKKKMWLHSKSTTPLPHDSQMQGPWCQKIEPHKVILVTSTTWYERWTTVKRVVVTKEWYPLTATIHWLLVNPRTVEKILLRCTDDRGGTAFSWKSMAKNAAPTHDNDERDGGFVWIRWSCTTSFVAWNMGAPARISRPWPNSKSPSCSTHVVYSNSNPLRRSVTADKMRKATNQAAKASQYKAIVESDTSALLCSKKSSQVSRVHSRNSFTTAKREAYVKLHNHWPQRTQEGIRFTGMNTPCIHKERQKMRFEPIDTLKRSI